MPGSFFSEGQVSCFWLWSTIALSFYSLSVFIRRTPHQHSVPQLHEYLLGQSVFDLKMTTVISRVVVLYYNAFLKQKKSSSFAKDVLPKTMHINFHHVIMIYLSWTISYKCMITRKLFSDVVMCSDIPALHLCLIISHIRGGIAAHC